ncbi:response regulator [candidate division KSB1 bacterium]|nr:response regulator [candidate division KSB1 bacterium]
MKESKNTAKILLIDDHKEILEVLTNILKFGGYDLVAVQSGTEGLKEIERDEFDLVFLDLIMPQPDGMTVLKEILKKKPETTVIMISGYGSIEVAVEATKIGAYDFLEKPLEAQRVLLTAKNALEKSFLIKEKYALLKENKKRFQMIGISQEMKRVFDMIDRVALSQTRILIQGESGTGKELVARAIHFNSMRASAPFHSLNCAAIPEELIESELFGHTKGAFTSAISSKKGAFQLSHQGTLLLDEIGDLSLRAQAKVLRVIEEGEVIPLGGQEVEKVDVRIISATNKKLELMIEEGLFREDLYHRINVVKIHIPPLRERPADIPPLVEHFIKQKCVENNILQKKISDGAMTLLASQDWKGNARELSNFVERLVIMSDSDIITSKDVMATLHLREIKEEPYTINNFKRARENFEKLFIINKLIANNWNVASTAKLIGLERTHLHRKIKKYNIRSNS